MRGADNRVVLITGASTGLGLAIARELARRDFRLVLTARESSMARFAAAGLQESARIRLRTLDVVDPDQREAVVADTEREWGGVDVLVNNAGVAWRAVVEHIDEETRLAQMAVNYRSPMALARLVLPGMRERRDGRILNISSVGGMMAMPTMAVYSASKFALEGASEALYYEVRPWNVWVSLVQPGFINSDGFRNVRLTPQSAAGVDAADDPYHAHYANMAGFIERVMGAAPATPERVARKVAWAVCHPKPPLRIPATVDAYLFSLLRRVLPRRLYHEALYRSLPDVRRWGPGSRRQS